MFKLNHKKLFIILLLINVVISQVSQGGNPKSFNLNLRSNINEKVMDYIDVEALIQEDKQADKEIPFRFGYDIPVNINLENSGTWDLLDDGSRIWRIKIKSEDAFSINLIFDEYRLPNGAELFAYSENFEMVLGAFTSFNNKDYGGMAISPIEGDVIFLEYFEPNSTDFRGQLNISHVVHGYKDVFFQENRDYGDSGSCNNNVNCPEGDMWESEIRAAAMILSSNGSRLCSGSMINNVRQDLTPYFLTANHCIYGNTDSWIIMFNYESPGCANENGPTNMTVQGTTLRASGSGSDFALFELSETPPESYEIHYSGWSAVDVAPIQPVAIHHPSGDIKKISFDYENGISDGWSGNDGSHWRVADWEDGTTEPGSSGSPLYDADHRIVGQLHGGEASCSYNVNDYYGKFSTSWNNGLSTWLDPDNTGTLVLDGTDAVDIPDPALTYDVDSFIFELSTGESSTETINVINSGEPESILSYNFSTSPFESPSGGPDNDGTFWADSNNEPSLSYDWIDISDVGTLYNFSNNDDAGNNIDIGFDFEFYNQNYSQCIISPNGWVGFGNDNNAWDNQEIPASSAPSPAIFGFWDDLNPVNDNCNDYCSGNVYYHSNNDRMVIWFNEVAHWWTNYENSFYDFQIVLHSNGEINFNYRSIIGSYSPTIGMQNSSGDSAFMLAFAADPTTDLFVQDNFTVSFKKGAEWLTISPNSGELNQGSSFPHYVEVNTNNLIAGDYLAYVNLQSNAQNEVILPVSLTVGEAGLLGDVNQDGTINVLDVVSAVNFVTGQVEPTSYEFWASDLNTDSLLNVLDIVQMVNLVIG